MSLLCTEIWEILERFYLHAITFELGMPKVSWHIFLLRNYIILQIFDQRKKLSYSTVPLKSAHVQSNNTLFIQICKLSN